MKTIKILAIALLAGGLLGGCNKDNTTGGETTKPDSEMIFNIGIAGMSADNDNPAQRSVEGEASAQTRSVTNLGFKSRFVKGDAIGIYAVRRASGETKALAATGNYIHNVKLTLGNDGNWTPSAKIYYPYGGDVLDFYAYYPYDAAATNAANIAFSVQADQSTASGYGQSDLMSATPVKGVTKGSPVNITMNHLLAMLELKVDVIFIDPNKALTATVRSVKRSGRFNLTANSGAGSLTLNSNGPEAVQMRRVETESYKGSYTYRALVPAQTLIAGKRLFFIDQEGEKYTTPSIAAALTMAANRAERYTANLPYTNICEFIPAGSFMMGSPLNEPGRHGGNVNNDSSNETQHKVTLTKDFYMSRYEVTNAQYAAFLNAKRAQGVLKYGTAGSGNYKYDNAAYFNGKPEEALVLNCSISGFKKWGVICTADGSWSVVPGYENFPVIYVTWYGAKAFAEWIGGSLPTEAQWEYACRGDYPNKATEAATKPFGIGDDGTKLYGDMANFFGRFPYDLSKGGEIDSYTGPNPPATFLDCTSAVGSYPPNNYGLYDMHGNVYELCSDWFGIKFGSVNAADPATDPIGPATGNYRVFRGGSWRTIANVCRSAYRENYYAPYEASEYFGFRVVIIP